jgi:hypothetical protein
LHPNCKGVEYFLIGCFVITGEVVVHSDYLESEGFEEFSDEEIGVDDSFIFGDFHVVQGLFGFCQIFVGFSVVQSPGIVIVWEMTIGNIPPRENCSKAYISVFNVVSNVSCLFKAVDGFFVVIVVLPTESTFEPVNDLVAFVLFTGVQR